MDIICVTCAFLLFMTFFHGGPIWWRPTSFQALRRSTRTKFQRIMPVDEYAHGEYLPVLFVLQSADRKTVPTGTHKAMITQEFGTVRLRALHVSQRMERWPPTSPYSLTYDVFLRPTVVHLITGKRSAPSSPSNSVEGRSTLGMLRRGDSSSVSVTSMTEMGEWWSNLESYSMKSIFLMNSGEIILIRFMVTIVDQWDDKESLWHIPRAEL